MDRLTERAGEKEKANSDFLLNFVPDGENAPEALQIGKFMVYYGKKAGDSPGELKNFFCAIRREEEIK